MSMSLSRAPATRSLFAASRVLFSTQPAAAAAEPPLLLSQTGNVLSVVLNRPKALNSLNLDMATQLRDLLLTWKRRTAAAEGDVGAFIVKGAGGKAFCAGGDVKSIWQELADNPTAPDRGTGKPGHLYSDFFRVEYQMNYLLGSSILPQVSLWDGIVMGGGVGISVLGDFRIATEKTLFAMPETAIGLFPDVGSSGWLPHLKEGFGNYIGISGCRLKAQDLIYSGIATHFVPSARLPELEAEIAKVATPDPKQSRKNIKTLLKSFHQADDSVGAVLQANEAAITQCFGNVTSVETIFENLDRQAQAGNAWAQSTLESLKKYSPKSMKLTLAQIHKGKNQDLKACLEMEFRMVSACMKDSEFFEGVRALLVDKDNSPKWNPATLQEISEQDIEQFFVALGPNELNLNF